MAPSQRPPAPPSGQPQQLRVPSLRPPGSLAPDQDTWEARPKYRTLLAALREVVTSAQSLKPLLLNAANLLHALLDAERVTIFALDPNNTFLRSLARSGGEAGFRVAKTNETIPGYVAVSRRTVNIRNAQNPDELKAIHPDLRHDPSHDVGLSNRTRQVLAAPILGALDGLDHGPGGVERHQRPRRGTVAGGGADGLQDQRVVEVVSSRHDLAAPVAVVRQQAVGHAVLALVSLRVGLRGALEQRQAQDVVEDVVAVLAVVEQRDAVVALAQVRPLVRAGLEARPVPRGVAVGRALDVAPLHVERGRRAHHVHRE
jgi:hypothetical protein